MHASFQRYFNQHSESSFFYSFHYSSYFTSTQLKTNSAFDVQFIFDQSKFFRVFFSFFQTLQNRATKRFVSVVSFHDNESVFNYNFSISFIAKILKKRKTIQFVFVVDFHDSENQIDKISKVSKTFNDNSIVKNVLQFVVDIESNQSTQSMKAFI